MTDSPSAARAAAPTKGVRGIVLAGGYERSETLFDGLFSRPLVPIAQVPLVCHALRWLHVQGVKEVTVCANSAARPVRGKSCADCTSPARSILGCSARDVRVDHLEDWMPRGAAGCVRDAAIRADASTFVVVDGTTVPLVDLEGLLETHRTCHAALTVVAHRRPSPADNGHRALMPSGTYVFDRRVLDHIPDAGFHDIKEGLIPRLYREGERVVTHLARGASPRMVNAANCLALNQWMVERLCGDPDPPGELRNVGEALVHESAAIAPGARLIGPVLLGPQVSIGAGACVIGPASIAAGCLVAKGAVVARSAIGEDCVVGEHGLVDRCLLADGVRVAPGDCLRGVVRQAGDGNGSWSVLAARAEARSPLRLLARLTRPATGQA